MATDPRLEALRALADTAMRIARGTSSARLALAGLRDTIDPATLPPELRERAVAEMERARRGDDRRRASAPDPLLRHRRAPAPSA